MKNKKCIVTGGAGFIGSHLADYLIELGADVYVVDNLSSGYKENINEKAKFKFLELTNKDNVFDYFKRIKPDYVFHLAAWSRMPMCLADPIGAYENNLMASMHVIEASRRNKVKRVVLTSSCIVYCEDTPYKYSKIAMEDVARTYNKFYESSIISLRYANVYGTRQNIDHDSAMFAMLRKTYNEKGYVNIFGDGEQTRDWINVKDVCRANVMAAQSDYCGEMDIATGKSISLNSIIKTLGIEAKYLPEREGDAKHINLDNKKAEEFIGFKTEIPFEEGIKEVWN